MMAPLVPCPSCGQSVSAQATACPACGHPSPGAIYVWRGPEQRAARGADAVLRWLFRYLVAMPLFAGFTYCLLLIVLGLLNQPIRSDLAVYLAAYFFTVGFVWLLEWIARNR